MVKKRVVTRRKYKAVSLSYKRTTKAEYENVGMVAHHGNKDVWITVIKFNKRGTNASLVHIPFSMLESFVEKTKALRKK